jgi:hypothetical protein
MRIWPIAALIFIAELTAGFIVRFMKTFGAALTAVFTLPSL